MCAHELHCHTAWQAAPLGLRPSFAGGAAYLIYLSRPLALTCGALCAVLWGVALRYGAFQRKSQRAYQAELANTNQVQP